MKPKRLFLSSFLIVVAIDQLSKWAAGQSVATSYNTGISLGLFSVLPSPALTVILAVVLVIVWFMYKSEWQTAPLASGLFFGGGLSNIIDRLLFSSVRDWLPIPYLSLYNNLADYAIALGLLLIIVHSLRKKYVSELETSPDTNRADGVESTS